MHKNHIIETVALAHTSDRGVALRLRKFHQVHPFPSIPSDVMRKVIWKVEKTLTNA